MVESYDSSGNLVQSVIFDDKNRLIKNITKFYFDTSKKILRDFWGIHTDCESQLKSWFHEAQKANWVSPNDIKKEFPSASFLQDNRVVFNIKGNTYRLIVKVNYNYGIIWIRFIGTHNQYDKIDAKTV